MFFRRAAAAGGFPASSPFLLAAAAARQRRRQGLAAVPALTGLFYSSATDSERTRAARPPTWTLRVGAFCAPKTLASLKGQEQRTVALDCCGEDAFVVAESDDVLVVGVADGVGGWRQRGVDPSKFSQSLMRHLECAVLGEPQSGEKGRAGSGILGLFAAGSTGPSAAAPAPVPAATLVRQAFWRLVNAFHRGREKPFGSSTVCVVALDKASGVMDAANLGDSGYIVVRGDEIVLRSKAQQHRFNAPYQLTLSPEGTVSDCSAMAASHSLPLRPADLILIATDGLWDNLFEDEILAIVGRTRARDARSIATEIVKEARVASERPDSESPFSAEARRHGLRRTGGKQDDITVVVCIAQLLEGD